MINRALVAILYQARKIANECEALHVFDFTGHSIAKSRKLLNYPDL